MADYASYFITERRLATRLNRALMRRRSAVAADHLVTAPPTKVHKIAL